MVSELTEGRDAYSSMHHRSDAERGMVYFWEGGGKVCVLEHASWELCRQRDRTVLRDRMEGMHTGGCISLETPEGCIRKDAPREQCQRWRDQGMHARRCMMHMGDDPGWGRVCMQWNRHICLRAHAQVTEVYEGARSPGCILIKPLTSG
jgi:hypothetical protein